MKVQLIVSKPITACIWLDGSKKPGDPVWVEEGPARHLLENGLCKAPEGPAELPTDGKQPLRRNSGWPLDRFAVIDRVWEGCTVVCIGGGPSLTKDQVEVVARAHGRVRCIAINNSYLLAPWADICYFADARWWEWHKEKPEFKAFAGQKVTIETTGRMCGEPSVFMLHNENLQGKGEGLSEQPGALRTGSNSGYQSINLSTLAGAKRVLLLGYDMKYGVAKKSHWHDGHPEKMHEGAYTEYARKFASMLPQLKKWGVEVINCTPGSAITAFPRGDIASVLGPAA